MLYRPDRQFEYSTNDITAAAMAKDLGVGTTGGSRRCVAFLKARIIKAGGGRRQFEGRSKKIGRRKGGMWSTADAGGAARARN